MFGGISGLFPPLSCQQHNHASTTYFFGDIKQLFNLPYLMFLIFPMGDDDDNSSNLTEPLWGINQFIHEKQLEESSPRESIQYSFL